MMVEGESRLVQLIIKNPSRLYEPAVQLPVLKIISVSDFNKTFLSILSHMLSVPDYSTYNKTYLRTVFRIGARVVRGKDWSYGSQDDFGVGTIISNFTASLLVRVRWDSGRIFPYRMGYSSKYDLYLVQGAL